MADQWQRVSQWSRCIVPGSVHRDQSSDMQREPGTLVKSPHRMLATQQTGLQAVDSRMSGFQSQDQPHDGHCPKALNSNLYSYACPRPRCRLSSLTRQAVPVFWIQSHTVAAHTGPFVHRCCTHEQRQLPLVLSSRPGKKGLVVKLADRPALEVEGCLAES